MYDGALVNFPVLHDDDKVFFGAERVTLIGYPARLSFTVFNRAGYQGRPLALFQPERNTDVGAASEDREPADHPCHCQRARCWLNKHDHTEGDRKHAIVIEATLAWLVQLQRGYRLHRELPISPVQPRRWHNQLRNPLPTPFRRRGFRHVSYQDYASRWSP